MKTKLRHTERKSNRHGGILFCIEELKAKKIPQLIDRLLGKRPKQAEYSYSDVIMGWVYSVLCNCKYLNDTTSLKSDFEQFGLKYPSHDVYGRVFKSRAVSSIIFPRDNKENHELNLNIPMNELLISMACKLGLLKPNVGYTMDLDASLIATEKYDSQLTYKKFYGYNPSVAFLGNSIPVFVEGKSGATHAAFNMASTMETIFGLLEKQDIKVWRFRSDAAAFKKDVIGLCEERKMEFFIRAKKSPALFKQIKDTEWTYREINYIPQELTSVKYCFNGKEYRVVIQRKKMKTTNNTEGGYLKDGYVYRGIITNNCDMSDEQVIRFYYHRGAVENNFANLNEFNFKHLPFSKLNENCVFMAVAAMGYTMYQHLLRKFSNKLHWVKKSFELRTFITGFILVTLSWSYENNERVAELENDGRRNYSPLFSRPPS